MISVKYSHPCEIFSSLDVKKVRPVIKSPNPLLALSLYLLTCNGKNVLLDVKKAKPIIINLDPLFALSDRNAF